MRTRINTVAVPANGRASRPLGRRPHRFHRVWRPYNPRRGTVNTSFVVYARASAYRLVRVDRVFLFLFCFFRVRVLFVSLLDLPLLHARNRVGLHDRSTKSPRGSKCI